MKLHLLNKFATYIILPEAIIKSKPGRGEFDVLAHNDIIKFDVNLYG